MGNEKMKERTEEKDLGVTIMDTLSPDKHVRKITGEVYNLLRNKRMTFTYMDEDMIK